MEPWGSDGKCCAAVRNALVGATVEDKDVIQLKYKAALEDAQRKGRQHYEAKQLCFCSCCFPFANATDVQLLTHLKNGHLLGRTSFAQPRHRQPYFSVVTKLHPTTILLQLHMVPQEGNCIVGQSALIHNEQEAEAPSHQARQCTPAGMTNAMFSTTCASDEEFGGGDVSDNNTASLSVEAEGSDDVVEMPFTMPTGKAQCEIRLPGNDGAEVKGCAGTQYGYLNNQNETPEEEASLELMLNIFAFMGKWDLQTEAVKDLLSIMKHSKALPACIQSLLPDSLSDLMTKIGQIVGIRTFRYDVCPNKHCRQLFRCESASHSHCRDCGSERRRQSKDCCLQYNSISDILRKICSSATLAKLLRHPSQRPQPLAGEIHDVYDTIAWTNTVQDSLLSEDARNVVLSFHQDGVQPFRDAHTGSLEPFTVSILNFPPWLRSVPGVGTFLIGLPSLPRGQETGVLHTYWEPFVDEVNFLYTRGIEVYDAASNGDAFLLRAGVLCGAGGGTMDSRGWPKNNCMQGPGASAGCFICTGKGWKAPFMNKIIYPLLHCYLPLEETQLRQRCSELNQPGRMETPSGNYAASSVDFTATALAPQQRSTNGTRAIAIRKEQEKKNAQYHGTGSAEDGVVGFSPLWNLKPNFAPTKATYDWMHALSGCIVDILQLLNGSVHRDKISKILHYEQCVNGRYEGFSAETLPVIMNSGALDLCIQRLERLAIVAPTTWKGMRWQFAVHPSSKHKPKPNTHDIHMFVGCIGAYALDNLLPEPYGATILGLLTALSQVKVKAVAKSTGHSTTLPSASEIRKAAVHAICQLVVDFPAWLLDHQWHQLIHILDNMPVHHTAMWHVERTNRFLVHLIHNR